jgi:osmotically-inducible protein OsmY
MRIRRDSRINDATINISVNSGLVTLAGIVSSYKKKLAVQLKAKQTWGVVSVDNRLQVFFDTEIGNPPQETIKKNAETILAVNSDIDESKIDVEIDSGIITLRGSVKWFWQLHRVDELISNIVGVIDVKNELTVVPSEKFIDEIIARDIAEELESSDEIDPSQVLVEVENGTVILSGTVRNYTAVMKAYEATIQQPGVKHVENNLSIAFPDS